VAPPSSTATSLVSTPHGKRLDPQTAPPPPTAPIIRAPARPARQRSSWRPCRPVPRRTPPMVSWTVGPVSGGDDVEAMLPTTVTAGRRPDARPRGGPRWG
jgi:hypothetical protein